MKHLRSLLSISLLVAFATPLHAQQGTPWLSLPSASSVTGADLLPVVKDPSGSTTANKLQLTVLHDYLSTTSKTYTNKTLDGGSNNFSNIPQSAVTNLATDLSNKQPLDADLTAIAAVTTTSFGRGLLDEADAAALRTTLSLVPGTDVQTFDADLSDLADGTLTGSKVQVQLSITSDASGLKLSGDSGSPGNSKYYGTDSGGTKGYHDLPAGGGGMPRSYLAGLELANNISSPFLNLDIAPGACRASDDSGDLVLASGMVKVLMAPWTVGSGNGAFVGTEPEWSSQTLHVYLIKRTDTGVVDVMSSLDGEDPELPPGYDLSRRIGFRKLSGGNIVAVKQHGDYCYLVSQENNMLANVGAANTPELRPLSVPIGTKVEALLNVVVIRGSADDALAVWDPDLNASMPGSIGALYVGGDASETVGAQVRVMTNTNGEVNIQAGSTGTTIGIDTVGWIDRRGRDN